jgi:sirohydrochlorin ferrochelatase
MMTPTAVLLIAHGSRRAEANADLEHVAEVLRGRGEFVHVQSAYLELCAPDIVAGGTKCVTAGARRVVLLPYFLSAGMHVTEDLTAARNELASQYEDVEFLLAEPLGRHPLLIDVVADRVRQAIGGPTSGASQNRG